MTRTALPHARQFAALGDGTRHRIVEILAGRPRSVAEIAGQLPVSRPAVSQHLRVLREAGLVTLRAEGTRHIYALDAPALAALRDDLDALWQTALSRFKEAAERTSPTRQERQA